MNDNQIIALIITVLRSGLNSLMLAQVGIKQLYQPRQSAIESGPTLYLHKVLATRYGYPSRKNVFNRITGQFDHTETIWRTPTFQVSGYALQDPNNIASLTASDITERAADVMQTSATRLALLASNVGIIRITDIRENYFVDERDRYEQSPSFDFVLSYQVSINTTVPPVNNHCLNVHPVLG